MKLLSALFLILSQIPLTTYASYTPQNRPEITLPQLLATAQANGELTKLRDTLFEKLDTLAGQAGINNVATQAIILKLKAQFDLAIRRGSMQDLSHWPQIHISHVALLQGLTDFVRGESPSPLVLPSGDFSILMGDCSSDTPPPALPSPLESIPSLRYGHFPNYELAPCVHQQSGRLAQILTALSQRDGFYVNYQNTRIETAEALIVALQASGHTVTMRDERTFANFLSFIVNDQANLRLPLWLNTGVVTSGRKVIIPMGHSQTVWYISGPEINARISFYLGTEGVGFYARTDARPDWAGLRVAYQSQDPTVIERSMSAAAKHYKRIVQESQMLFPTYPSHGYGALGVCNDSTALIEIYSRGSVTGYPLVRPSRFATAIDDDLSSYFSRIPYDPGQANLLSDPAVRQSTVSRILEMIPLDLAQPALWWDAGLREIYLTLRAEGGSLSP